MRRNELHITNLIVPVSRKSEPNNYAHTMNTSDYNTVNTLYANTVNTLYANTMNTSLKNTAVTSPAFKNTHLSLNLAVMKNTAIGNTSVKNTFPESETGIAGSSNPETTAICTVTACKSFAAPSREEHTSMKNIAMENGFMKNSAMENTVVKSTSMENAAMGNTFVKNTFPESEIGIAGSSNPETTAICTVTACKSFAAPSREEHTSMKDIAMENGFMKNTSMKNAAVENTAMGNTQKLDDRSENRRRDAAGSLYGHVTSAEM